MMEDCEEYFDSNPLTHSPSPPPLSLSYSLLAPTIRSNLKSLSTLRLQQGKIDAGAAQAFTLSRKGEKKKALDQEKDDKTGVSLPLAIPNTETSTTKKVSSSKVHVAPVFALEAATAMRNKLYSQALRAIKDQIYADHILTSQEDVIGIAKRYYLEPYTKILRECGFIPWSEYEAAENRHGIIGLAGQNLNDIVLQKFSSMYRSPASSSGSESEMTSIDEFGNTALINNNNNNKITTSNLAKTLISKHTLQPEIFALSALSLALEQKHISTPRRTAIRLISQLLNLSDKETSDLSSLTNDMRSLVFTNTHELGSISSSSNNNEEDMIFDMEV